MSGKRSLLLATLELDYNRGPVCHGAELALQKHRLDDRQCGQQPFVTAPNPSDSHDKEGGFLSETNSR